jgi:para-nitrobenzyl esterase
VTTRRSKLRLAMVASASALAIVPGTAAVVQASPSAPQGGDPVACAAATTVRTADGPVCGTVSHSVTEWLGIPYAAPPVGALRWRPPQPPAPWKSALPATSFGNQCVQYFPLPGSPARGGSEDCLFLNVSAPHNARAGSNLPVLVHIPGGGFVMDGNGNEDTTLLASAGDDVVVSINYRLGIFGFLAGTAFGPHSGDYGLQDQQAALRWVQQNIAEFGGDPRNVTVYGESAGASSVCDLIASPAAAGLFQRGIIASGEYNTLLGTPAPLETQDCKSGLPSQKEADAAGAGFAAAAGCPAAVDVASCLRALPVATLLSATGFGYQDGGHGTVSPTVNGLTLTTSLRKALQTGQVNRVPVIAGTDRDEDLFGTAATAAQYVQLIGTRYGRYAPRVLALYPLSRFDDPAIAFRTVAADSDTVCPSLVTDQDLARLMPVYAYENDDDDIPPYASGPASSAAGASHVGGWFLSPASPSLDADQQALQNEEVASVTHFARTGNPGAPGTPPWPQFGQSQSEMTLAPAGDSAVRPAWQTEALHNCGFWDQIAPSR